VTGLLVTITKMNIFKQWATWTFIITFIVGGLGSVTGLVSPTTAGYITIIVSALGGFLHQKQVVAGSYK